jgi:hypothetical protein
MWCEHCRDHYPEDHYEPFDVGGGHKVGAAWGPTGDQLAKARAFDALPRWLQTFLRMVAGVPQ